MAFHLGYRWGVLDPERWWLGLPVSVTVKWRAWANLEGPLGGLGDDFRASAVALETAKPHIRDEYRQLTNFLPPWRKPSDYRGWANLPEPEPEPEL